MTVSLRITVMIDNPNGTKTEEGILMCDWGNSAVFRKGMADALKLLVRKNTGGAIVVTKRTMVGMGASFNNEVVSVTPVVPISF